MLNSPWEEVINFEFDKNHHTLETDSEDIWKWVKVLEDWEIQKEKEHQDLLEWV